MNHFLKIRMPGVQAYLAGLTFALAASPCSTPVLATLLGYVASTKVTSSLIIQQDHTLVITATQRCSYHRLLPFATLIFVTGETITSTTYKLSTIQKKIVGLGLIGLYLASLNAMLSFRVCEIIV